MSSPRLRVALYQPEIPPNTGNIMRLCANSGAELHLIKPMGFRLDHAAVRRAGLDYRDLATVREHEHFDAFREAVGASSRLLAFTTRATRRYDEHRYGDDDILLFGPETRGLPQGLLDALPEPQRLRLPMRPGSRSLNLSNTVAIAVYEAWRQRGFDGAAG